MMEMIIMSLVLLSYFSISSKLDKLTKKLKYRLPTFTGMTDIELISLYDKFLQAKNTKGYVKIGSVIARIASIKSLTHGQDKVITLEAKDISGQPVERRSFKLSDLKTVQDSRLLDVGL